MTHINRHTKNGSRVLIVASQGRGGIWQYACSLSKALAVADMTVALAAPFPYEPVKEAEDIPVWSLGTPSPNRTQSRVYPFLRIASHLAKVRQLHRAIANFRPDVIHFHDRFGHLDFAYFEFLRRLGMRVVYTAHDVRPLTGEDNWFDRARYRAADAVVVHSSNGARDLVTVGMDESKIVRLPHANYLHLCQKRLSQSHAKRLLGIPPNGRSILFFGGIASYKGFSILIEAVSQLVREDSNVYLVVAGEPLEKFEPYRRQIGRLGLTDRVILELGYVPFDEFGKFFSAADVVALPYQRIYQSGVLQLAYGFGRPVVVTNVGGLGEAVADDRTGVIAATADADGVASAIRQLLGDKLAAEEMGERGPRLAATKYSWERVVYRTVEMYGRVQRGSIHSPVSTDDAHNEDN